MQREEHVWNVSVLQRVQLSNPILNGNEIIKLTNTVVTEPKGSTPLILKAATGSDPEPVPSQAAVPTDASHPFPNTCSRQTANMSGSPGRSNFELFLKVS
jgi:hypothetical protein